MSNEARVVPVEVDPSLHKFEPTDAERETWAVLDTAYNLLRDHAVKSVIDRLRQDAAEQGSFIPEDAILFAQTAKDGIAGYRDLAVNDPLASRGFLAVFEVLIRETADRCNAALGGN